MSRGVYYNEFDRHKAAWLRHLIEEGAIAAGVVDERPIQAVQPEDLHGFMQCHFFAGVGVWSHALRLTGWDDDRPVWTGSCPCGPFSVAGKKLGFEDPRHLWPEWFRLIGERRPDVLFGEQSDDADAWVDLVSADLEGHGYAIGAPDIPAAGFGGAHIRQRFFWVADADHAEWWADRAPWHDGHWPKTGRVQGHGHPGDGGAGLWLADPGRGGDERRGGPGAPHGADGAAPSPARQRQRGRADAGHSEPVGRLGDAWRGGPQGRPFERREGQATFRGVTPDAGELEWVWCRDNLWRPIEPATCPLANEAPARLGRLRGYGDAIDAEAAANFIGAYLDAAPQRAAA